MSCMYHGHALVRAAVMASQGALSHHFQGGACPTKSNKMCKFLVSGVGNPQIILSIETICVYTRWLL